MQRPRGKAHFIGRSCWKERPLRSLSASQQKKKKERLSMFLILALVLVLAWIAGFVIFHTAGFLIHLLLIFAVISIIFHFLRGRSSTA
jgi:predicted nucleic acid-binding Zn ribbon protein